MSAVFFLHISKGSALSNILYLLVIFHVAVFSPLGFLVIRLSVNVHIYSISSVESLCSFSNLQCHTRDQSCSLNGNAS